MSGVSLTLVTGGCRSGKSRYALESALAAAGEKIFLATCPRIDGEMDERITRHRKEREGGDWQTVEEPIHLAKALRSLSVVKPQIVVIDCVSLWVNNLMYEAEQQGTEFSELLITQRTLVVLGAARELARGSSVFFTTSEVGLGIVPDAKVSRRYRDFLGRANQDIAARADRVVMLVSGIPLVLKSEVARNEYV